jgi:acyl-[acyl-carrier-protein]-phospholipid O-acyltransferase/long-chain-fatty-acid--[acyl-carrier-protein] ligase
VAAGITNILTSRRFIEIGKFDSLIQDLQSKNIHIVYLEDLRTSVNVMDKLTGLMAESFPKLVYWLCCKNKNPNDPAVVLFTSGSEGTPKGVVLSHSNIQSNRLQMASRIDFGPQDIVFNCLPMFHSFGLTGGTLLPILSGLKTFYYPSPLHYRIVPELVYDTNATLLFGTDTFLSGYAKYAHPYDFYSLRYAFAGAEKLKDETRSIYAEKFGVRIFEGYGATETSPVLSINTPMQNRKGTVGRFVPYIEHKVEKVEGIDNGGQLWVRGPNIMTGYLKNSNPGVIETPQDGWYDTGDIVNIDIEGFIEIKGRTKRFAKIGGEMISLSSIEMTVAKHWPKFAHAIVSVPHEKKGEAIVLLTTNPDLQKEDLIRAFQQDGLSELGVPKQILHMKAIPLLGTGKTDYVSAKQYALDQLSQV